MGHLTNVANNVVQSVEKGKNKTTLEAIFNGKSILESLVNLEPMYPVVSMVCGVAAMACLAMCLHVSSRRYICSCLLC